MAAGLAQTRTQSATVTAAAPTVAIVKTGTGQIVGVQTAYLDPNVTFQGFVFSDATGQAGVAYFKVAGPTTSTAYKVNLSISEVNVS